MVFALYGPGVWISHLGLESLVSVYLYVRPLAIADCSSVAHKQRATNPLPACAASCSRVSCGHQSSRALGCLPAGGAGPTGGRGSRTSSGRGPHGPRAPGLALGEPVVGSNRICRRCAAGDAVCIQRIPVAVLATPAATSYLRALVVVCKDPGRSMSFTDFPPRHDWLLRDMRAPGFDLLARKLGPLGLGA